MDYRLAVYWAGTLSTTRVEQATAVRVDAPVGHAAPGARRLDFVDLERTACAITAT
jgi:hypothetical protein